MAIGENHILEGGTITFEVDSILTKLGVFKPSENGSHKGEPSSFQPSSSFWLGIVSDIQNRALAQQPIPEAVGERRSVPTYRNRHDPLVLSQVSS